MRIRHRVFALAIALTLAACGSDADEDLSGEALSMDDVMAEAEDGGIVPQPGEYRTRLELVEMSLPGMPEDRMDMVRRAFAEGAGQNNTYCVTGDMDREEWISQMTDNDCSVSRFSAEGGDVDLSMTCRAADGPQGTISMTGTADETSSDMQMQFQQPVPGMGDASVRLRVRSERIGDCA
ncbi:DUF3617 domain-containing protein [Aurantiacibacter spongiae]|uniref:DUF3617 domain-containing protein n=1 Tax=Aurantiacibacter spongiae TaxID=2488860 RepID=A0A3N5DKR6_9SPHN|nr:DUF3617 domain-containing protein [Aurantiacibacter spongiae]RPF72302.1 DUF3617 domain-containing protein [Aurantiacibacter spongiae]